MPFTPTYPGVYIEEIPSGVRTIIGVATSITAFIGRANRGPTDEAVVINSFGDFERLFGGLWIESSLGYAVRDFYLNGGSQAIIVRLHNGAKAAEIAIPTGGQALNDLLPLVAANVGEWGMNLSVTVDHNTKDAANASLFNLTIVETDPVTKLAVNVENILNVSIDRNDSRYVPRVLKDDSMLVRVKKDNAGKWIVPNVRPSAAKTKPTANSGTNGTAISEAQFTGQGKAGAKEGLFAFEKADLFNLLCIPPYNDDGNINSTLVGTAAQYCEKRRAMLLVDP